MGSEYRYFLYHSRHKEIGGDDLINVWNSDNSSSGTALPNMTTGSIPDQSVSSITSYTMTTKTIPFTTTVEEGLYTVVMNLADNSTLTFKDVQITNDYAPVHLTTWSETTSYSYNGSKKTAITYVDICTSGIKFSGNYVEGKGYYGNGMWSTTHTLYANRKIISVNLMKQDIDWVTLFNGNSTNGTLTYQNKIPDTVYSLKFRVTYYTNPDGWSHTTLLDNNNKLFMFKGSYFYLGGDNSNSDYDYLFKRQSYVIGLEDNIIDSYITNITRTGMRCPNMIIYKVEALYELPQWNVMWDTGESNVGYTYITFNNPIPDDVNNIEIRLTIDTTLGNYSNYENKVLTYSTYGSFINSNGDNTIRYLSTGSYYMDIYECTRKGIKIRKNLGTYRGYMKKIEVLYL